MDRAGADTPADLLAWGGGRLWAAASGGTLRPLTSELNAAVAPALAAAVVWCVSPRGELRRLEREPDGAWREAQRRAVDSVVHAVATSTDGAWALAAHGEQLTVLDGHGRIAKVYDGSDLARRRRGRANWLGHLPQRRSFVASWPALGELWEIPLDPAAAPIHDGLVHDYRMDEAIASPGFLGVRRVPLAMPLPLFDFTSNQAPWVAGIDGTDANRLVVVHLDVRRAIASLPVPGARPAGAVLRRDGTTWHWYLPASGGVVVIDALRWRTTGTIETDGVPQALQLAGGHLWALTEARGGTPLLLRQHGEGWSASRVPVGAPIGLIACPGGLAVAGRHALQRHATDGALLQRWTAPDDVPFAGAGCS